MRRRASRPRSEMARARRRRRSRRARASRTRRGRRQGQRPPWRWRRRRTSSATSLSGCRACASRETTAVSSAETTACTDVDPATRSPIALAGAPHSSSASTVSAASSDAGRPRTAGAAPGRKRRPTTLAPAGNSSARGPVCGPTTFRGCPAWHTSSTLPSRRRPMKIGIRASLDTVDPYAADKRRKRPLRQPLPQRLRAHAPLSAVIAGHANDSRRGGAGGLIELIGVKPNGLVVATGDRRSRRHPEQTGRRQGRPWSQAVATSHNWWQMGEPQERPKQAKALPWLATGCRGNAMVRRGSTVRARRRAPCIGSDEFSPRGRSELS